jgi:hypothetical protein
MIRVNTSQVKSWAKDTGKRENAKRMLLTVFGTETVSLLKREMVDSDSWVTGETGAKLMYKVNDQSVSIMGAGYTTKALETGRKPGNPPPVEQLRRWARLKLGNENLAYMVARKIGQKGTRPKKLISRVFDLVLNEVLPTKWNNLSKNWL